MAVREDGQLSMILVVAIPTLVVSVGMMVSPASAVRGLQTRIDRASQVLREQIPGMRVVRHVRPGAGGGDAVQVANADLTQARCGRAAPGVLLPDRDVGAQRVERGRVWFGGGTRIGARARSRSAR